MSWFTRFVNSFRSDQLAEELRDEAEFHLEQRSAALQLAGVEAAEARRRASLRFGGDLRKREESREVKMMAGLESMIADMRYGLRQMAQNKALTAAAIVSLGLAIGSVTAAFALIDAVLFRPLPVHEPEKLVYLTTPGGMRDTNRNEYFSFPLFQELRKAGEGRVHLFGASGQGPQDLQHNGSPEIEKVALQYISGDALMALGVRPGLGRLLTVNDDAGTGERPVAVISYEYWQRRFGGDGSVAGKKFTFNERSIEIVGVTHKGFTGLEPGISTDVWVPMSLRRGGIFQQYGWQWFRIMGYLEKGTRPEEVQSVLNATFQRVRRENEPLPRDVAKELLERFEKATLTVHAAGSGPSNLRREFESALWVLAGTVFLVLLIACANVCNLLLARATAREKEIALRVSIGAGRGRLIQQMLIESGLFVVLSLIAGGLLGLIFAPFLVGMLGPADRPLAVDLRLDWRFTGFLLLLAVVVTLILGLVPALRASRTRPADGLRMDGTRIGNSPVMFRVFLTAQVAFCFLALFGASLFVGTMQNLQRVDVGFNPKNVTLFEVAAPKFSTVAGKGIGTWHQLEQRLSAVAGVQSVARSGWGLFGGSQWTSSIRVTGKPPDVKAPLWFYIGPGFGQTLQLTLLEGRLFDQRDALTEPVPLVAIVNQAFSRRYFDGQSPVGRQFIRESEKPQTYEIVGMIRDARDNSVRAETEPTVYAPVGGGDWQTLNIRGAMSPNTIQAIRTEIRETHPALSVTNVVSQERLIEDTMIQERLLSILSTFFGALAVLLAGIGLYGVLNYTTLRRTHEIGIRIALGARRIAVVRLVVRDAFVLTILGSLVGVATGLALARLVSPLLYGVKPSDLQAVLTPVFLLLTAAALASALPAFRAIRIEPSTALRYE
ncbi:MAG: ABC transporter permease [Bryobacteraceae bacterium]|nr:ABC transporter permease [Bryobacteraceae bacterium]